MSGRPGQRGRPAVPTYLKLLRGNPGRQVINKNEPQPPAKVLDVPSCLTGYALEEWQRVAPSLELMGVLTFLDAQMLGAYCVAYGHWRATAEKLDRLLAAGELLEEQGDLVKLLRSMMQDMLRLASEFGLTPASRSRIAVEQPTVAQDPFKDLVG